MKYKFYFGPTVILLCPRNNKNVFENICVLLQKCEFAMIGAFIIEFGKNTVKLCVYLDKKGKIELS